MSKQHNIRAYESLAESLIGATLELQKVSIDDSVTTEHDSNAIFEEKRAGPTTYKITPKNLLESVYTIILESKPQQDNSVVWVNQNTQQDLDDMFRRYNGMLQTDLEEKNVAVSQLKGLFSALYREKQHSPEPAHYQPFHEALHQLLTFVHPSLYHGKEFGNVNIELEFTNHDLKALYSSVNSLAHRTKTVVDYLKGVDANSTPDPDSFRENLQIMEGARKRLEGGLKGSRQYGIILPRGALKAEGISGKELGLATEAIASSLYYQQ